jgi:hypothetical protein
MGSSTLGFDQVQQIGKYYFEDSVTLVRQATGTHPSRKDLFVARSPIEGLKVIDHAGSDSLHFYLMVAR